MPNKISDELINRAVELWCRKLLDPVYNVGDDSHEGELMVNLALTTIKNDKAKAGDIIPKIEVFREVFTNTLIELRNTNGDSPIWLNTDYTPGKILADAADQAEIPHSFFSTKSDLLVMSDYVSASWGYGAEDVNHYPLSDGRWLITSLRGTDISKVIDEVMSGNNMGFNIEPATT